ncbi:hypothetical protein LI328DRAFT_159507 [Trichoderma asperelloides]|nr:hypothetical protein LI328DRAFT_159507 [Trichoderma asperelloides]
MSCQSSRQQRGNGQEPWVAGQVRRPARKGFSAMTIGPMWHSIDAKDTAIQSAPYEVRSTENALLRRPRWASTGWKRYLALRSVLGPGSGICSALHRSLTVAGFLSGHVEISAVACVS